MNANYNVLFMLKYGKLTPFSVVMSVCYVTNLVEIV